MTRMNVVMSLAMIPPMLIADGGSGELADMSQELARRRAIQQEKLVDENSKLSEASRELVDADATARKELTEFQSEIQQDIHSERRSVDHQLGKLKDECREIAIQSGTAIA